MAISFVASATGNSTSGGVSIPKPTGTAEGDVMVAFILRSANFSTGPTGWTVLFTSGISNSGRIYQAWTKKATASEPTSYSWPESEIGQTITGSIQTYRGADGVGASGVDNNGNGAAVGTTINSPAITTTKKNSVVLAGFAIGTSAATLTDPSGTTRRSFINSGYSLLAVDAFYPDVGATTAYSSTSSKGSTLRWGSQVELTIPNNPPNAPTALSPDGKTLNRANTNRFSWTFSDPDSGDSQSKYDLRYRLTGAATWTTVTGTTPNQFHDFAGGTFVAGDYEWQVRTYDSVGEVGPYSASSFFTAADAPAGPSITDPVAGQTIATETYTVRWSTPSQEAFQVRTVADSLGSPDATTVYTDTGEVTSTTARSRTVSFSVNNRAEHVQVRVRDGGLWSSWISVNVTVSYTTPATPTVAVDDTSVAGAIVVQASHPTPSGSQPPVTHVDVHRRVTSTGGDGIRIRAGAPPTAVTVDHAVASGVDYGYRIRAYGDNGTSSWSAWSEASTAIAAYYGGSY